MTNNGVAGRLAPAYFSAREGCINHRVCLLNTPAGLYATPWAKKKPPNNGGKVGIASLSWTWMVDCAGRIIATLLS